MPTPIVTLKERFVNLNDGKSIKRHIIGSHSRFPKTATSPIWGELRPEGGITPARVWAFQDREKRWYIAKITDAAGSSKNITVYRASVTLDPPLGGMPVRWNLREPNWTPEDRKLSPTEPDALGISEDEVIPEDPDPKVVGAEPTGDASGGSDGSATGKAKDTVERFEWIGTLGSIAAALAIAWAVIRRA